VKKVTGTYHFTTALTQQGVANVTTILQAVAFASEVSFDPASATFTFTGPPDLVNFAEWALPLIDRPAGDNAPHEYTFPSGDVGRVRFLQADATPQQVQEQLTILRTVADVQKIFAFNPNRAMVMRGPAWQLAFSDWIMDQLNVGGAGNLASSVRAFRVGGPYPSQTEARTFILGSMTTQLQVQELLTTLRIVGEIQKIFSYTATRALVLRAAGSDLERAEWIVQQLDSHSGPPQKAGTFATPGADDVTRAIYLPNATPVWVQSAVKGMRSELDIRKIFAMSSPANIVVRGTADQVAAAMAWLTAHNALAE